MSISPERLKKIRIEELTINDLWALMEIESMAFSSPWSEGIFRQEFNNPRTEIYGAKYLNHLLGYVIVWHGYRESHITNIAVHPAFRRMGIGSLLLQKAIDISTPGSDILILEVRVSNTPAIELYKKFGFKKVGLRKNYYLDNRENAIVMEKNLKEILP